MRLMTCLFAVASLATALPARSLAQDGPPPPRVDEPRPPPPPREVHSPYPRAPAPGPRFVPRPHYHTRRFWGWGWGWYPLYPVYPVYPPPPAYVPPPVQGQPVPPAASPSREQDRIYTRFSLYGAGRDDGYMAGLTFAVDSRLIGFNFDVSALAREQVTGPLRDDRSDPAALANAHVTWTFLSDRSVRLRLETGVSMLSLPESQAVADRPWRGKTLFGPDVGVSGHLGILGPLGVEGYARLTPFPERIADTFVGLAVHGGPVGVSAGWRWVHIDGDEVDAPEMFFRGPQVGLVLAF